MEKMMEKKMNENEDAQESDLSQHRQIISHAMNGEPAQMGASVNAIIRDKIDTSIEARRAEIGANMFQSDEA